jgi:Sec-independent protein secretion pathway component TatC
VLGGVLPGVDPVTTLLETLPLFALYEGSILLLRFNEHRSSRRRSASSQIGANYENGRDRE